MFLYCCNYFIIFISLLFYHRHHHHHHHHTEIVAHELDITALRTQIYTSNFVSFEHLYVISFQCYKVAKLIRLN